MTWSNAQQYCLNDSKAIVTNATGFVTHLVALESAVETTSLIYWMKGISLCDLLFVLGEQIFSLEYSNGLLDRWSSFIISMELVQSTDHLVFQFVESSHLREWLQLSIGL